MKVALFVLAVAAVLGALYGQWRAGRRIRAIHRKHFPGGPARPAGMCFPDLTAHIPDRTARIDGSTSPE